MTVHSLNIFIELYMLTATNNRYQTSFSSCLSFRRHEWSRDKLISLVSSCQLKLISIVSSYQSKFGGGGGGFPPKPSEPAFMSSWCSIALKTKDEYHFTVCLSSFKDPHSSLLLLLLLWLYSSSHQRFSLELPVKIQKYWYKHVNYLFG